VVFITPILFILVSSVGLPISDSEILYEAKYNCRTAKPERAKDPLLKSLLKIEREYGVPDSLRGMLLASACQESGYNPNAKGDHKFSKKRKPKAIGLFQMWKWWEKGYGIDRRDPQASARAYLRHITKQLPKVRRKCKISRRHKKRNWIVAWVTGIRGYKKEGRCRQRPKHLRTLRKWHRSIAKKRKQAGSSTVRTFAPK
jgi:hypothetical protein